MRTFYVSDLLRCTGGDNLSAAATAFRAEIHNPVGGFNHVSIVLNDHDGITLIAQAVQHGKQLFDVGKV